MYLYYSKCFLLLTSVLLYIIYYFHISAGQQVLKMYQVWKQCAIFFFKLQCEKCQNTTVYQKGPNTALCQKCGECNSISDVSIQSQKCQNTVLSKTHQIASVCQKSEYRQNAEICQKNQNKLVSLKCPNTAVCQMCQNTTLLEYSSVSGVSQYYSFRSVRV